MKERGVWMPAVIVRKSESLERALKRFNKQCDKTSILSKTKVIIYYGIQKQD